MCCFSSEFTLFFQTDIKHQSNLPRQIWVDGDFSVHRKNQKHVMGSQLNQQIMGIWDLTVHPYIHLVIVACKSVCPLRSKQFGLNACMFSYQNYGSLKLQRVGIATFVVKKTQPHHHLNIDIVVVKFLSLIWTLGAEAALPIVPVHGRGVLRGAERPATLPALSKTPRARWINKARPRAASLLYTIIFVSMSNLP